MTAERKASAAEADIGAAMPEAPRRVMGDLAAAGFQAYAVGGCVRDSLLGIVPHDWDVTTDATPAQMKRAVHAPSFDTGIAHGTVSFVVGGEPVETTTFRTDGAYTDGRHPDSVRFARSLEEDLARRDFTVNAMAWSPATGIVDPFGGAADLRQRLLRCVGDPERRFAEDGLRIMRGLRIAAGYGLRVEPRTAAGMHANVRMLDAVSRERIAAELVRLAAAPDGCTLADVLLPFGDIVWRILPELGTMARSGSPDAPAGTSRWQHAVDVAALLPGDVGLRLAALFHGSSAPDGAPVHDAAALRGDARVARRALARLTFPRKTGQDVAALLEAAARFPSPTPDRPTARRLIVACRGAEGAVRLLALLEAEARLQPGDAESPALERVRELACLEGLVRALAPETPLSPAGLAIGGGDLIARGWKPGPGLGAELARLFELVIDGKLANRRADLLAATREPGN